MVVRKRYIGSMLRIERNLEIVAKVAVGAATKASTGNSTSMNYMVAGRILRERGTRFRALNRFCRIDIPVRPSLHAGRAAVAGRHHGGVI